MAKVKNYYEELNTSILSYEENKCYHTKSIEWICNRIDWCWKFRKITQKQMEELVDRICNVMEGKY